MEKKVKRLLETTDLYIFEIAEQLGVTKAVIDVLIRKMKDEGTLSVDFMKQRRNKSWSRTKLQEGSNHMQGKTKELHPNYKGEVADGKGYIMVLKPKWYTGRPGSKHIFKHSLVMCEALGLTELPARFVVHHINGDTTDNEINNLALMSMSAHTRFHQLERVTTRRKP